MKHLLCTITIMLLALSWSTADETVNVRHINLKMEMPGGFGPVLMSEQPTLFLVQLPIGGGSSFVKHPLPNVNSLDLQVWLLRKDGTAIPQHDKPTGIGIGNAGSDTDYMIYTFNKVAAYELAGIVVRVQGKLYCQEIRAEK